MQVMNLYGPGPQNKDGSYNSLKLMHLEMERYIIWNTKDYDYNSWIDSFLTNLPEGIITESTFKKIFDWFLHTLVYPKMCLYIDNPVTEDVCFRILNGMIFKVNHWDIDKKWKIFNSFKDLYLIISKAVNTADIKYKIDQKLKTLPF